MEKFKKMDKNLGLLEIPVLQAAETASPTTICLIPGKAKRAGPYLLSVVLAQGSKFVPAERPGILEEKDRGA